MPIDNRKNKSNKSATDTVDTTTESQPSNTGIAGPDETQFDAAESDGGVADGTGPNGATSSDTPVTAKTPRTPSYPWNQERFNAVRDTAQLIAAKSDDSMISIAELHTAIAKHPAFAGIDTPSVNQLKSMYSQKRISAKRYGLKEGEPDHPQEKIDATLPPVRVLRHRINPFGE